MVSAAAGGGAEGINSACTPAARTDEAIAAAVRKRQSAVVEQRLTAQADGEFVYVHVIAALHDDEQLLGARTLCALARASAWRAA